MKDKLTTLVVETVSSVPTPSAHRSILSLRGEAETEHEVEGQVNSSKFQLVVCASCLNSLESSSGHLFQLT